MISLKNSISKILEEGLREYLKVFESLNETQIETLQTPEVIFLFHQNKI